MEYKNDYTWLKIIGGIVLCMAIASLGIYTRIQGVENCETKAERIGVNCIDMKYNNRDDKCECFDLERRMILEFPLNSGCNG